MSDVRHAACVLVKHKTFTDLYLGVSRKEDNSDWGLPGGKAEEYESYIKAAIRETKEETGLDITNLKYVFSDLVPGDVDYFCVVYVADYDGSEPIQRSNEGAVGWVNLAALLDGSFGDFNRKLFTTLGVDCDARRNS